MSHHRAPTLAPEAVEAEIRERGYAVVEGLLTPLEVKEIKASLRPWLQGERFGRNDFEGERTERVYALLAKAPPVARIVEHPVVLALLDRLLPRHYLLSAALAINVHPGETPQPFHCDDSSNRLPGPRPRPHAGVSTIWAFDDFTSTNGATEVVPGSHLWTDDRFPPRDEDIEQATMPAGSALIFLGNLLHRGGANRSTGTRLAITPQYCAPWWRQIENMVLAVPPPVAGRYSERIQELLGYSTVDPGFMGYVDGVHPRRLIDPAYRGRRARGLTS
jgi:ectoine hydroxylase-related dioxygenase (phytanoyl-CoA dioxygenase family)